MKKEILFGDESRTGIVIKYTKSKKSLCVCSGYSRVHGIVIGIEGGTISLQNVSGENRICGITAMDYTGICFHCNRKLETSKENEQGYCEECWEKYTDEMEMIGDD